MSIPDLWRDLISVEAPRAWLGVATALAIYGGKRALDRLLPRGRHFRFMDRWLDDDQDRKH